MTFMKWSSDYLTGIEIVDQQHQHLVDLINDAAPVLATLNLQSSKRTQPLLDALINYVGTHFSTEDQLMVSAGIDLRHLQQHRQLHAEFADHVRVLRRKFEKGEDLNGTELLRFLSNWLAFHILSEDQHMAQELAAIEHGLSAAEAYDRVEGSKAEILQGANTVLVNALVNLFSQLTEQNRVLTEKSLKIEAAHQELDDYRKNLEQQVIERTNALMRAKDAAEAASRAKSRFLAVVSHELMTPMNAIIGFAHLLERANLQEKQREQAKHIIQSSQQLIGLLNEVLQYARLESGEIKLEMQTFQAASLLTGVSDKIQKNATDKGLTITLEVDAAMPPLIGDAYLLSIALEALAVNSVKFTESGHINLSAAVQHEIENKIEVIFKVCDTGIGIPQDKQEQLFQAFEQLDAENTRNQPGIGLGLAICARTIRLLGGRLTLESKPASGSCFTINLWLETSQAPAVKTDVAQQSINQLLYQLELLLSQDNMEARKVFGQLQGYLSEQDHEKTQLLAQQVNLYTFDLALSTFKSMINEHQLILSKTPL